MIMKYSTNRSTGPSCSCFSHKTIQIYYSIQIIINKAIMAVYFMAVYFIFQIIINKAVMTVYFMAVYFIYFRFFSLV